ncbi:MAG: DUF4440 domain-containing protein [Gemmatimonadetes bacterium]|nr:DUF4440 domain-containing protein [Gemmatimonadota bacterium]
MRRYLLLVLVGAVASLNASALLAQEDDIRERYDAYNAAFSAADAEAVVAFYADNAIRVDSDGSVMDGIAAIREDVSTFFGDNDYVLDEATTPDIQASGDLAVTLSVFREHWTPKAGGETSQQVGQWLVVWQRQSDGSWMILREMWAIEETEEAK